MSRIDTSPGRSNARIAVIVASIALIGMAVGGASAIGVIMAMMPPPEQGTAVQAGQQAEQPKPVAAAPSLQDPAAPAAQSAQASTTQQPATPPAPPQTAAAAARAAQDRQDHTAQAEMTFAQRAPWPNPVPRSAKAMRRRAIAASEADQPAPAPVAQPPASSPPAAAANGASTNNPADKADSDLRKPRVAQQPPPVAPAAVDQGGDAAAATAAPPRPRIARPAPAREANNRDRWDRSNGFYGLYDSAGQNNWNNSHWNNWNDRRWNDGRNRWGSDRW